MVDTEIERLTTYNCRIQGHIYGPRLSAIGRRCHYISPDSTVYHLEQWREYHQRCIHCGHLIIEKGNTLP